MKHRSEHPAFAAGGSCRRCGCHPGMAPSVAKRCPPGYWMTTLEAKTWDAASDTERDAYEEFLCAGQHKGKSQEDT